MTSMFPSLSLIISVSLSQLSHAAVSALCRSIKLQCELYSSRQIAICLDPYCGLGFVLWCLARYWPIINHKNNAPSAQGDGGGGRGGFHSSLMWSGVVCLSPVFTQVTSPSSSLPLSWRAACHCGWARSLSTASGTRSAPTLSWSSVLKDWALRLTCSR